MRRAQHRARSARSRKNGARSATIKSRALGALKLASEARDENVPAKRADFFEWFRTNLKKFANLVRCKSVENLEINPRSELFRLKIRFESI